MTKSGPIVGILCNIRQHETGIGHTVNTPYLNALRRHTSAHAVLIPNLLSEQDQPDFEALLSVIDGLVLTGGRSNLDPLLYGAERSPAHEPLDTIRDQSSFAVINWALSHKLPLLGICRGMQEINVFLGGTLIAAAHECPNAFDHRMPDIDCFDTRHAARHHIDLSASGLLERICPNRQPRVNSLHRQAIDQLGRGLFVEAVAPDGMIEAISVTDHPFALGVQWHPEHQTGDNVISEPLFKAFESAMLNYRAERLS